MTVSDEKDLDELLSKLYVGLKPSELKRLQTATLKANPHLGAEGGFKRGTVIVVPTLERKSARAIRTIGASPAAGVEEIITDLKEYAPTLMQELEAASKETEQLSRLFKSAPFRKALDVADKETLTLAESFASSLKVESDENDTIASSFPKEVAVLQKNLEALLKNLD